MPARETFDGAMIILGGALLLAPGFITDIVGFLLLIPPTRALLRGRESRRLARRRVAFELGSPAAGPPAPAARARPGRAARAPAGPGYDYEGTAHEVTDPAAELRAGRAAMTDAVALEFTRPTGEPLRFEWPTEALAALDPARRRRARLAPRRRARLGRDRGGAACSRRGFDDGRLLAVAALRPAGADGPRRRASSPARSATPTAFEQLDETLLSTEYGADGLPAPGRAGALPRPRTRCRCGSPAT